MRTLSKSEMAAWIAGFWDGEGSVHKHSHSNGKRHTSYWLCVGNTDHALLDCCRSYLSALGIGYTEFNTRQRGPRNLPFYVFHICKAEDIRLFARLIPIQAPHKKANLQEILDWINRDPMQIWEDRKDKMLALWAKGHSCRCIANHLGFKSGGHAQIGRALRGWGVNVVPCGKQRPQCRCLRA